MHKWLHSVGGVIQAVMGVATLLLLAYFFVVAPFQVNGQSMFPTFKDGELIMVDKISWKKAGLQRGDVVVFSAPPQAQCQEGTGCDFVKRVVGLPGETVEIMGGRMYVNGAELDEPYLSLTVITDPGIFTRSGAVTVPEGSYFLVGDNRPHSNDSRAWGPVQTNLITGRVMGSLTRFLTK